MLDFFLSYLLVWKYALLFAVACSASLWFPIPATAIIMAAGAFASQGYFGISEILAYSFAACVLWDVVSYGVSYRYGRRAFEKMGLKKVLDSAKFAALEELFSKHSSSAIFTSRFLATSLWPTVNLLSGFSKTPFRKFIVLDLAWEFLYVALFAGLGYAFGDQWETISSITEDVTSILVLGIVFATLSTLFLRYRKRRNVRRGTDPVRAA